MSTLLPEDFDIDFEALTNTKIIDLGNNPKNELYNLIGLINAKRIIENIIKNPSIVEVGRKDLIGKCVGQTAPLVKKAFDKAYALLN